MRQFAFTTSVPSGAVKAVRKKGRSAFLPLRPGKRGASAPPP
jgi:hypothetical protein